MKPERVKYIEASLSLWSEVVDVLEGWVYDNGRDFVPEDGCAHYWKKIAYKRLDYEQQARSAISMCGFCTEVFKNLGKSCRNCIGLELFSPYTEYDDLDEPCKGAPCESLEESLYFRLAEGIKLDGKPMNLGELLEDAIIFRDAIKGLI